MPIRYITSYLAAAQVHTEHFFCMPLKQHILLALLGIALHVTSGFALDPITFTSRSITNQVYARNPAVNQGTLAITGTFGDVPEENIKELQVAIGGDFGL